MACRPHKSQKKHNAQDMDPQHAKKNNVQDMGFQKGIKKRCSRYGPKKYQSRHIHKRRRTHKRAVVAVEVTVAVAAVVDHRTPVLASVFVEVCLEIFYA